MPGSPVRTALSTTPQYAGGAGTTRFAEPLYLCCTPANTGYNTRGELAKLRWNFSEQTSLTVSYLGGQSGQDYSGTILGTATPLINFSTFVPPAGYTGSVPAGVSIPFDTQANTNFFEYLQQNLFQAEVRTSLGATSLLGRAYSGYGSTLARAYTPGTSFSVTENAWGGIALCPAGTTAKGAGCVDAAGAAAAPVTTFFNGTPVTLTMNTPATYTLFHDYVRGFSLEADRQIGETLFSLAVDRSNHDPRSSPISALPNTTLTVLPPGPAQQFSTVMARAQTALTPRLSATLANYLTWYASHYTGNGGATWSDATHASMVPRLGFSWRPFPDIAWRFALGASIAPPFISQLSSAGTAPVANPAGTQPGYFINANNGQIAPEKAFGYNLGADWRVQRTLRLSGDVYYTHVRDMFFTSTRNKGRSPQRRRLGRRPRATYVTQVESRQRTLRGRRDRGRTVAATRHRFQDPRPVQRAFTYNPAGVLRDERYPNQTNLGIVNDQPPGQRQRLQRRLGRSHPVQPRLWRDQLPHRLGNLRAARPDVLRPEQRLQPARLRGAFGLVAHSARERALDRVLREQSQWGQRRPLRRAVGRRTSSAGQRQARGRRRFQRRPDVVASEFPSGAPMNGSLKLPSLGIRVQIVLLAVVPLIFLVLTLLFATVLARSSEASTLISQRAGRILEQSDRMTQALGRMSRSLQLYQKSHKDAILKNSIPPPAPFPTTCARCRKPCAQPRSRSRPHATRRRSPMWSHSLPPQKMRCERNAPPNSCA